MSHFSLSPFSSWVHPHTMGHAADAAEPVQICKGPLRTETVDIANTKAENHNCDIHQCLVSVL